MFARIREAGRMAAEYGALGAGLGLRGLRALEAAIVPAEREMPVRSRPIVYFDGRGYEGPLSVRKALSGKRVLLIGVTGFHWQGVAGECVARFAGDWKFIC